MRIQILTLVFKGLTLFIHATELNLHEEASNQSPEIIVEKRMGT